MRISRSCCDGLAELLRKTRRFQAARAVSWGRLRSEAFPPWSARLALLISLVASSASAKASLIRESSATGASCCALLFGGVKSTCGPRTVVQLLCDVVDVRIERIKTQGGLEPVMPQDQTGQRDPIGVSPFGCLWTVAIDVNQVVDQLLAPFFRKAQYELGVLLNEGRATAKNRSDNQIWRDFARPTRAWTQTGCRKGSAGFFFTALTAHLSLHLPVGVIPCGSQAKDR